MTKRDEQYRERAADLLERTADRFQSGELGWTQGAYKDYFFDDFCYMGGLMETDERSSISEHSFSFTTQTAIKATSEYLGGTHRHGDVVGAWNDQPGRQPEEVIDLMKHVAKDLRNRA